MGDWLAVFDLDGTLVETGPDLTDTCNVVLALHGLPQVPAEQLHPFIGLGARQMLAGALEASGTKVPDATLDQVLDDYFSHYSSRIAKLSRPYPEVMAALDRLDAEGTPMAVCTNKREGAARQLLTELKLADRFKVIAGADTYGVSKPDPAHLYRTVEAAGGELTRTVFVGDSRVDRLTASHAGVPFVGLTYGYSDTPMEELSPDKLLRPGEDVGEAILEFMR